ncbi:hypothetical protein [Ramlibacter sp.]|uniref:hypothetical protein n=1 Tax=Ramlibacter sp. TaxID=1917967 RepID=UPI0035B43DFB
MDFSALASAGGSSERQAALFLHSMTPDDRHWLLQALPAGQRDRLTGLLKELLALQIPPDAALVRAAIGPARAPAAPQDDRSFLMQLAPGQIEALAGLLQQEPARLAAQCLVLDAWPWRAALLARLPARQRQAIGEHLHGPDIAPDPDTMLARTLLSLMRRHCEATTLQPPAVALPARPRWLVRLWKGRS